jgi:hypothetical protein
MMGMIIMAFDSHLWRYVYNWALKVNNFINATKTRFIHILHRVSRISVNFQRDSWFAAFDEDLRAVLLESLWQRLILVELAL